MRRTYDYVLEGRKAGLSSTPQTVSKLVDRNRISVGRRPNPRRCVVPLDRSVRQLHKY
jgi:hypothetical protein